MSKEKIDWRFLTHPLKCFKDWWMYREICRKYWKEKEAKE